MKKDINITLNKQKKFLPWIIIVAIGIFWFLKSCGAEDKNFDKDTAKTDTVYVKQIIPGDTIKIKQTEFIPVGEEENKKLREKIAELKNDKQRLEYLLAELSIKTYDTTYTFERGRLNITDTIQGTLLGRNMDLELFPVEFTEKTITKTVDRYPKWAITGGISTGITTDFKYYLKEPYIGINFGIRNRKGVEFEVGYNSINQFRFELSRDLFVNY